MVRKVKLHKKMSPIESEDSLIFKHDSGQHLKQIVIIDNKGILTRIGDRLFNSILS